MTALTEEHYQRLWQPPVPSQVLQFIAASAAICYTAEKALKHVEEGESGLDRLEQMVEGLQAKQMVLFFQQLVAGMSNAQEFFGTRVEYSPQSYSVEVMAQTPLGQKHVFMAPGANVPPSNGSWRKCMANVTSLRYLAQAELDEALSTGHVALQHASDRLGAELSQPLGNLINTYAGYRESFK